MIIHFTYRMYATATVKSVVSYFDHIVIETVALSNLNRIIDNVLDWTIRTQLEEFKNQIM